MQLHAQLNDILTKVHPRLLDIDPVAAAVRPAPDKWSRSEVLGHLIDSACNNHARFVRAQFQDSLIFPGYQQEGWVSTQHYQQANWENIVTLWISYNRHIAHIIAFTPEEKLYASRQEHDFATMTHGYIADASPDSLFHLMKDYVAHLEHHLTQILPDYQPSVLGK
ncbi:MAG: DinB family protein [Bacteroidota bacterium]